MTAHAPDPYQRRRALWPRMRLFARWVIWQYRALEAAGLLNTRNTACRWWLRQLARVEHGLVCLLIIGAQRLRFKEPTAQSRQRPFADKAEEPVFFKRSRRLALSLKPFDLPVENMAAARMCANRRRSRTNQRASQMVQDCRDRIEAVLDVLADADPHIERMARRLAQRGVVLKRRPDQRPINLARLLCSEVPAVPPFRDVAFVDTS